MDHKQLGENMKPVFTKELPTKEGFYWFTDFGEHTPCVVEVRREDGKLWAQNEELCFVIKKPKKIDKDPDMMVDGYFNGEEMWCYIEPPVLPNGKKPKPMSY